MDLCHKCHDTIELRHPVAHDPKKNRTYCKPCIDRLRTRLIGWYFRLMPAEEAIRTVHTWPSAA